MSYTLTCPDPECATVFELPDADFDKIYESEDDITCTGCGCEWPWEYEPKAKDGEEVTLVEYDCDDCNQPITQCTCDDETAAEFAEDEFDEEDEADDEQ